VLLLIAMVAVAMPMHAQRGGGRGGGGRGGGRIDPREFANMLGGSGDFYAPPDFHGNPPYDGRFTFARIKYRGFGRWSGREGPGWSHDYPDADVHFMRIMKEITSMRPFIEWGNIQGGVIVALDDPLLFKYPVAYLSEPGGWFPNDAEAKGLRTYLQKGGFLIVDDFPAFGYGTFEQAMARVLPGAKVVELTGKEAIFDCFYTIDLKKMHPSYYGQGTWLGIYENNDPKKRLIAVIDYNNDVGESWQWSGQGFFSVDVENEAYKLGINYLVYALTH
jgi:hypothetical protein